MVEIEIDKHLKRTDSGYALDLPGSMVKNKKQLWFAFPDTLVPLLEEYLQVHRPVLLGENACCHLIINSNGTPITVDALSDKLKRITRKYAGVKINSHQFRHMFTASYLYHNGGDITTVSSQLGHKTVNTTMASYDRMQKIRASEKASEHYNKMEKIASGEMKHNSPETRGVVETALVFEKLKVLESRLLSDLGKLDITGRAFRTMKKEYKTLFKDIRQEITTG